MHVSGKIAAWFVAVLIIVAVVFASKAFAVRDAWMQIAQQNEATIKKNDDEIAAKTKTFLEQRGLLARTMIGWDREWPSVGGRLEANGNIALQLGTNSPGMQTDLVVYVFVPNPDGTSVYLGDFKITKVTDNSATGKPNSRRRPTDLKAAQFPNGRVRTLVPNSYIARLGAIDQQLLSAEQSVAVNKEELARQALLSDQTDKLIAARLNELNGDKALEGQPLPVVHIKGLLTAIVDEEELRNAALIEADKFMRELKRTRDRFEQIRKENRESVDSLPQPVSRETGL
jgi:hypothetical protein